MTYVEVMVADSTYHGTEALTYAAPTQLAVGALVVVPLRHKQVLGVVVRQVGKPAFQVKTIDSAPSLPPLPPQLIALLQWLAEYYPAPLGIITQLVLPRQLPKKPLPPLEVDFPQAATPPPLTQEQKSALEKMQGTGLHILHGETGSGKTRVYIELAAHCLGQGKSAIILTPEIGLTSQLAASFRESFDQRVIVMHSRLTETMRAQRWEQILKEQTPVVVIGARSALFSPLRNIGLIVMDESHDTAYKQDQAPYYQTLMVAATLANLHKATLVLGSATPAIADYYIAQAKARPIVRMAHTAIPQEDAAQAISVVDLRDRTRFSHSSFISDELIEAVRAALERHEQALLFLNRRGTARIIFCERCGWQALCPHCDLPLVYHGDSHLMRCHSCDYKASSPSSCPNCHNVSIIFKSIGTKAVSDEIQRLVPNARLMRFDTDNKKHERIEEHYEAIRAGQVDILIGTQAIAKGLDLPRLSVVGIIIADTSLYFPDFSAQERTYQLLSQVLGRIGRGHRRGQAIIQTYAPDSPLIEAVLTRNWHDFYTQELLERQQFGFPPFTYLLKLTCKRATSNAAAQAAEQLAKKLRAAHTKIAVEGPTPAFHEKVQNKFVWQIIVKARRRGDLLSIIKELPSGWSYDIDPLNLL